MSRNTGFIQKILQEFRSRFFNYYFPWFRENIINLFWNISWKFLQDFSCLFPRNLYLSLFQRFSRRDCFKKKILTILQEIYWRIFLEHSSIKFSIQGFLVEFLQVFLQWFLQKFLQNFLQDYLQKCYKQLFFWENFFKNPIYIYSFKNSFDKFFSAIPQGILTWMYA